MNYYYTENHSHLKKYVQKTAANIIPTDTPLFFNHLPVHTKFFSSPQKISFSFFSSSPSSSSSPSPPSPPLPFVPLSRLSAP